MFVMSVHDEGGSAPYGSVFVRDVAAARAQALADKVELITSQGGVVPEALAALAASAGPAGDVVVLVEADAATLDAWRLCGDEVEPVAVAAVEVVELPVEVEAVEVEELEPVVEVAAEVVVEPVVSPFAGFVPAPGFAAKKRVPKKPGA